jgi:hypothetical protein
MDAVTHPHPAVEAALARGFAPYRIDILARHPDFKEACAGGRVLWSPTFIVADWRGSEVRRWVGWLPPASFVAELDFCLALAELNRGQFAEARAGFDAIVARDDASEIRPEALYWQGIAGFLAGGKDWEALRRSWTALAERYPGQRFGTHASVIDDVGLARDP